MKFSDGYWRMKPGVRAYFPVQVCDVMVEQDALTVYAAPRRIVNRWETLNIPLITVRFSSPMENVIRVQIWHHKGAAVGRPEFGLNTQRLRAEVQDGDAEATLRSGRLTVHVGKKEEWNVTFKDGDQIVTRSGKQAMGIMDTTDGKYVREQLNLGIGECVYGLGERFTPFVKNGQTVDMWNADPGTSSDQAYKNVPFYVTSKGYGVFVNHPERVSFEVATENVERVQFSVKGEYMDYFLIYGPSLKGVLERYTALTGRPALPPAWSFGLWLTTSFVTSYDEKTITSVIEGMAERDIPLHVFHFDCFWMKEFQWCDFKWDKRVFPDPKGMLERLKSRGLHICVWINPYIAQKSELFEEGMKGGYLIRRPNGDVWQCDDWQAGMGIVDFTNPEARGWFQDKLRELLEMGVDCFKTDFGESIPSDASYYDGSDPVKMHNYYTYLYNKTVFELLESERGVREAVLFARSATAGSQKFPVHWGGDSSACYESMAETLRGGLSLSLCGFGFWSHDIGGFDGTPTPDLYKRWCAFGLLSSHSRLHGNASYRVPWFFDEEAVNVLRFFVKLKCRLMPYIYGCAVEAHESGVPVMRPMVLEFQDEPVCRFLDQQYMLGDSLLVAPVFSPDGIVEYYLPAGRWTNFITGEVIEGGRWLLEKHNHMSIPLMARPSSVIPVGSNDRRPDYDYADNLTLHVFELQDNVEVSRKVPKVNGEVALVFRAKRKGDDVWIDVEGDSESWSVLLRGVKGVRSVDGGIPEKSNLGMLLKPHRGAKKLKVRL